MFLLFHIFLEMDRTAVFVCTASRRQRQRQQQQQQSKTNRKSKSSTPSSQGSPLLSLAATKRAAGGNKTTLPCFLVVCLFVFSVLFSVKMSSLPSPSVVASKGSKSKQDISIFYRKGSQNKKQKNDNRWWVVNNLFCFVFVFVFFFLFFLFLDIWLYFSLSLSLCTSTLAAAEERE